MHGTTAFALVGAFLSFAAAVPMNKRDVVWVTMTQEDVVTVPVTKTVWLEPGEETAATSTATSAVAHYGHGHGHNTKATSTVHSTVTVKPIASSEESAAPSTYEAPTTSTSVYVAPPATSTSEYVVPTPSSTSVHIDSTTFSSVYIAPTTSSVYIAPTISSTTSSTSVYVAPTTSSTSAYVAPPATSTTVAPVSTSSPAAATATQAYSSGSGSSPMSGKSYSGDLTYYSTGMGACGITSGYSDHIVAISEVIFDEFTPNGNPNNNPLCGQKVSITGSSGSKYEATIVDRCTGCAAADLDLSQGFFDIVEPSGDGRVHNVDWTFL
nr:allergen asp f 7 [Quercus suber]